MRFLSRTGPLRVHQTEEGPMVVADVTPAPYVGSFRVRLASAQSVLVGMGTVEQRVPLIRGVRIDGTDESGAAVKVPALKLEEGPNAELRSWVFLQVRVDPKTRLLLEDEEELQIVHGNDLRAWYQQGFSRDDGEGRGRLPLAMLVWKSKTAVQRVVQNILFHQKHSYRAPLEGEGNRGWHFFAPNI